MSTYKLIPSSWGGTATITDPSNAYTDTTSATYASVAASMVSSKYAYLGGFDFSTIPQGSTITSLTVKVKAQNSTSSSGYSVRLYSDVDGTSLSDNQVLSQSADVYTLSLTESVETIIGYSSTLCIRFSGMGVNYPMSAYGAEIIVEVTLPVTNKIIYGNETLIDLTGDTATASDVAVGKTFHLASGLQATGTLSLSKATATTTGSTTRTVSFTNLTKQPSWFMMICSSTNTTARNSRVQHMLYDGTTTTTYYTNSSTAGSIATSTSYGSFTYSSGTLAITVTTAYIGAADWELYYL